MPPVSVVDVERWLAELGIEVLERDDREGVTSWDVMLDGRRRRGVRATLILDPALALVAWVHYAPPLDDSFRRSYRKLLRWNDEYPFVKFAIAEDERPILETELPVRGLDREELGLALARLLAVCDLLIEESAGWIWRDGKIPPTESPGRGSPLLARYADRLGDLLGG